MTETQFYVLTTVIAAGLAGIGAAIRFSTGRIVRALDKNSDAMLDNTKSNAVLTTKIDSIAGYVREARDRELELTPPQGRPRRPATEPR